ncbi:MAG: phosphotransferase [Acidimicrobiales bacterium]
MDELARLHAGYWESPRFADDLSWVPDRAGFGDGNGRSAMALEASAHFVRRALDSFADDMPPGFRSAGEFYASHVGDILDLWDDGERTLVHGDPHEGNLFDDGARAGFFDWAMFSRSPGIRDVAYFCCTSLPIATRRSAEVELVGRYRANLGSAGIALAEQIADRQYREMAVFAWVSMASTAAMGSRWQPVATGTRAMVRATAAVQDLSSIDALADRLR